MKLKSSCFHWIFLSVLFLAAPVFAQQHHPPAPSEGQPSESVTQQESQTTGPSQAGQPQMGQAPSQQLKPDLDRAPDWVRNLPPERQQVYFDIYHSQVEKLFPLRMRLRAQRALLAAELAQQQVNREAVDGIIAETNDLRSQIDRERVDLILSLKQQFPHIAMNRMLRMFGPGAAMMGGMGKETAHRMGREGGGMMGGGRMGMMGGRMGMMGCPKMGGHGASGGSAAGADGSAATDNGAHH